MKILSIETSCDETAISIVEIIELSSKNYAIKFKILGNTILSQIELHKKYGGVFPALAKREHAKNLIPLLKKVLKKSNFLKIKYKIQNKKQQKEIENILNREYELSKQFLEFIAKIETPNIDAIAVTIGPGLEPALWVGINFAKALAFVWNKPIVSVNHMEGHIFSALLQKSGKDEFLISNFQFPIIALLISGGHTQLVLSKKFLKYEIIGETLDDAVGEAFDKVARMLGLPYPGGPEISRLANKKPRNRVPRFSTDIKLPRPMLKSNTCDFSFSGLKTAVLYTLKKITNITEETKQKIAKEFEDVVVEVLTTKTKKALIEYDAQTLIIGGGVSANERIKTTFENMVKNEFSEISLHIPSKELATDNAIMISIASYFRFQNNPNKYKKQNIEKIKADGNLKLM